MSSEMEHRIFRDAEKLNARVLNFEGYLFLGEPPANKSKKKRKVRIRDCNQRYRHSCVEKTKWSHHYNKRETRDREEAKNEEKVLENERKIEKEEKGQKR